uniref:1-acyl-sn-glycerol-3-phosphate acyltransferase n=1 Tax=Malurus cyaneus samueli TaxID=2593467 RepID=A0A8C5TNP6_9PASS
LALTESLKIGLPALQLYGTHRQTPLFPHPAELGADLLQPVLPTQQGGYIRTLVLPLKYIFGIQIVVKGKENLRTKKPYVLVLNHQTSLDIMVMMEILPKRCVPIAKKEILYMGTFGLACWLAGIIFIDRKRREESISTLTEVAQSLHKDNLRVLIFPEGTRNHGDSMLPFKRGAFLLAVKAQVPIIPVVLSSYYNFYNQKEKRFTPGKMIIQILPEVETLGLGPDDVPKLTAQIRDSMDFHIPLKHRRRHCFLPLPWGGFGRYLCHKRN